MENKNRKKGFTLIEIVVCTALLTVLSAAFLQLIAGSSRIVKKSSTYDANSYSMASAIETGELPIGMKAEKVGEATLNLSGEGGTSDGDTYYLPYRTDLTLDRNAMTAQEKTGRLYYFKEKETP